MCQSYNSFSLSRVKGLTAFQGGPLLYFRQPEEVGMSNDISSICCHIGYGFLYVEKVSKVGSTATFYF